MFRCDANCLPLHLTLVLGQQIPRHTHTPYWTNPHLTTHELLPFLHYVPSDQRAAQKHILTFTLQLKGSWRQEIGFTVQPTWDCPSILLFLRPVDDRATIRQCWDQLSCCQFPTNVLLGNCLNFRRRWWKRKDSFVDLACENCSSSQHLVLDT